MPFRRACLLRSINYGNTGCRSLGAAQGTIAVVGCTSRSFGFSNQYCGAEMDMPESDFVSDVTVSEASLEYPRVLIPGAEVNGKQELALTCADSADCKRKCDYFAENAHDGGLPAPSACTLCHPPCPSNIGTSATDLAAAVSHDTALAAQLAAACLGGAGKEGCLCAIFLIVRGVPLERRVPPSPSPTLACLRCADQANLAQDHRRAGLRARAVQGRLRPVPAHCRRD